MEGQKGSTVTTPHFHNKSVFNSFGVTTFNCSNGFENHDSFRINGGGAIHTPAGSILNHVGAKLQQFGHDQSVLFNAAQDVRNRGGKVYFEGTLNSTSSSFANEIIEGAVEPKTKTYDKKNRRTKEVTTITKVIPGATLEKPGQPAYFHAGRAFITAHSLLNRGSALSARELLQFNGTKLDNLTRDYFERGTKTVEHKKSHRTWYLKKKTKRTYEQVPYETLIGSDVAKFKSQGDMRLNVGGRIYDRNNVAALNGNRFKNTKIKKTRRKKGQASPGTSIPGITNTGEIYADAAYFDLDVTSPTRINFSDVNSKRTEIPLYVSHLPYYEEMLKRPGFWTLDEERNTPFKIIPRISVSYPDQEEVSAIRADNREAYTRQEAERASLEALKVQLIAQFNQKWEAEEQQKKRRPGKTRSGRKKPQMSREEALNKFLEERGIFSISCEPNPDEWSHIDAASLPHMTPRLAHLPHPDYKGEERLLASPPVLADVVVNVMMERFGFASLSKCIYNSILYGRVLEDQGYLNARRVHGLPPLPTPENWKNLSPKEQLRHQLREVITLAEVEKFPVPTIIYELVNFHGELVLSPINTFPKHIRDAFKSIMGRKMFANYFAMRTRGDLTIRNAVPRKGAKVESTEANVELENVMSPQGPIQVTAAETLFIPTGTVEGTEVSLQGKHVIAGKKQSRGAKEDAPPVIRATEKSIDVKAKQSLSSFGAEFDANMGANIESGGTGYLGNQEVIIQTTKGGRKNRQETRSVLHNKTKITARKEGIRVYTKQEMELEGIDTKSGTFTDFKSDKNIKKKNVNDEVQTTQTNKKSGVFGGKSKTVHQTSTSTAIPDIHEAGTTLTFKAKEDIEFGYSHIKTEEVTRLIAPEIKMAVAKSTTVRSKQKNKNSLVWQKHQQKGQANEKIEMTQIDGKFELETKKIVVETPEKVSLNDLAKDPRYAWAKKMVEHPNATVRQIKAEHKKWNHKSQGLTPGGAALLSLAVGIATGGAGSAIGTAVSGSIGTSLGSAMAGKIVGTMASAGFATLTTQASVSLVNNRGNIGKTLKELGSKKNIRSTAMSVVAAGLTGGILESLKNPETAVLNVAGGLASAQVVPAQLLPNLSENIQRTAVQTAVSTSLALASGEKKMAQIIQQGIQGAVASVVQSFAAQHIGAAYKAGEIDTITHKLSHAIAGGFAGALFADDPGQGALAGATGAVIAELVAEGLSEALTTQTSADLGRFAAGATALLAQQDVNTAIFAATTAVENNSKLSGNPDQRDGENGEKEDNAKQSDERGRTKDRTEGIKQKKPTTPTPLNTDFRKVEELVQKGIQKAQGPVPSALQSTIEIADRLHQARQGHYKNQAPLTDDRSRVAAVYGLDLLARPLAAIKAASQVGEIVSKGIDFIATDIARTGVRRIVREVTGNQWTGQYAGDLAYSAVQVALLIGNPFKGSGASKLGNAGTATNSIQYAAEGASILSGKSFLREGHGFGEAASKTPKPLANQNAINARRTEAALPSQAPQPKPRPTKAVGTPAEEASSARRIQQARAMEKESRELQVVSKQQKETPLTAPKAPSATAKSAEKEKTLTRSKKMDTPAQGMKTPAAAVPQATKPLPRGFKPQQNFDPPINAAQQRTAPQPRVQPMVGSEARVQPTPAPQLLVEPTPASTSIRSLPTTPGQVPTVSPPRAVQPMGTPQPTPIDPVAAFELKHNKKAVQNMTDHELAQSLANRAERKMPGGTGPEVGKLKHKYAEDVLKRYQESTGQRPDLVAEGRFKNNQEWDKGMGLKDTVRPDLYNKKTKEAFDYKFGDAEVTQGQRTRYEAQLPRNTDETPSTLTQIKPSLDK